MPLRTKQDIWRFEEEESLRKKDWSGILFTTFFFVGGGLLMAAFCYLLLFGLHLPSSPLK